MEKFLETKKLNPQNLRLDFLDNEFGTDFVLML